MVVMVAVPILALIAGIVGRGPIWKALAFVVVVIASAWWVDVWLLFATDELSGWFDCYPHCSGSQKAASAALIYLPVLTMVLLLGAAAVYAVRSLRRTRSAGLGRA
jgi:hypothetical protein